MSKMSNTKAGKAERFVIAHRMAKAVHVKGECYAVTFGQCLKQVIGAIKAIFAMKQGDKPTINAAQVLMLVNVFSLKIRGSITTDEGTYPEAMGCFKVERMAQYIPGLFDGAVKHDLTLTVRFENDDETVYKVVR